jgi:ubiquinone/menaquinone biosynthesis C-methylase UbiE
MFHDNRSNETKAEGISVNLGEPFSSAVCFDVSKIYTINLKIPFRLFNEKNIAKRKIDELITYLESQKIRFTFLPLPPCVCDSKEKNIFSPYEKPVFSLDLGFVILDHSQQKEKTVKTMESCKKCIMFEKKCPGIKFISHYANSMHNIEKWLEEIYNDKGRVLDVGCGSYSILLKLLGKDKPPALSFLEPDHYNFKMLIENSKFYKGREIHALIGLGENLPFGNGKFDAVFLKSTYDHLLDLHGTLNEIKRILKPGGKVFILEEFFENRKKDPVITKQINAGELRDLISKQTHFRNHTLKDAIAETEKYLK